LSRSTKKILFLKIYFTGSGDYILNIFESRNIDMHPIFNLNHLNIFRLKYMKKYKGKIFLLQINVMNLVHEAVISDQFVFQSVRPLKVVAFITGSFIFR
jgi:hypothetical protein